MLTDVGLPLLAFLRAHGAGEQSHSAASLMAHLLGTRSLLVEWGARSALSLGGLFHSVYGTESYREAIVPIELRAEVRGVIGSEAEEIAFTFGAMTNESFLANLDGPPDLRYQCRFDGGWVAISLDRFCDLCSLTVANWLEQRPRLPRWMQEAEGEFRRMRPYVLPAARVVLDAVYGFDAV